MAYKEYPLRVGWWVADDYSEWRKPFRCHGRWIGPEFEDLLPGRRYEQQLEEGTLRFHVNVLWRPDRPKRHKLETVLILDRCDKAALDTMFEYDTWERIPENEEVA